MFEKGAVAPHPEKKLGVNRQVIRTTLVKSPSVGRKGEEQLLYFLSFMLS